MFILYTKSLNFEQAANCYKFKLSSKYLKFKWADWIIGVA